MNNSLKSDKSLSRYLIKVVQKEILRRNNPNIRRQDVKNGCECSSIAVRQKQSPFYLHTLGPEPAVQESFLYETRSFEEPKTLLLALLPPTLFKIDKSVAFSVSSTGTLCLLPISILGASAGIIHAVPDTVKKVPGLAPVLILKQIKFSSC